MRRTISILFAILIALGSSSCGKSADLEAAINEFEKASEDIAVILKPISLTSSDTLSPVADPSKLVQSVRRWTAAQSVIYKERDNFSASQKKRIQEIQARAVNALTRNMSDTQRAEFVASLSGHQKARLEAMTNASQGTK